MLPRPELLQSAHPDVVVRLDLPRPAPVLHRAAKIPRFAAIRVVPHAIGHAQPELGAGVLCIRLDRPLERGNRAVQPVIGTPQHEGFGVTAPVGRGAVRGKTLEAFEVGSGGCCAILVTRWLIERGGEKLPHDLRRIAAPWLGSDHTVLVDEQCYRNHADVEQVQRIDQHGPVHSLPLHEQTSTARMLFLNDPDHP